MVKDATYISKTNNHLSPYMVEHKRHVPVEFQVLTCGFIKGRYIGDNIRSLLEVIDLAEEENLSCIILSIDFEKAFDTISWKFLNKCLIFFNFGSSFQQWIKLFFNDISSCVLNTGWSTELFKVSRGVRQGCPIAPYLFLLCAVILAISVTVFTGV